jgi:hypothetical protein
MILKLLQNYEILAETAELYEMLNTSSNSFLKANIYKKI